MEDPVLVSEQLVEGIDGVRQLTHLSLDGRCSFPARLGKQTQHLQLPLQFEERGKIASRFVGHAADRKDQH